VFDPASLTLGQISSTLRDFAIVGFLLTVAWKSRGYYEIAKNFFSRVITHMDTTEAGMNTLLTNHLVHIEKDLKQMARHQVRGGIVYAQDEPEDDDDVPPSVIQA
jgi:hypothetical protein